MASVPFLRCSLHDSSLNLSTNRTRCVTADAVPHLGFRPKSHDVAPSMPPVLPGDVADVMDVDLHVEGAWNLSDNTRCDVIDIHPSFPGDSSLIQEKWDEFSINRLSSAEDVLRLALRGLNTLDEQQKLFSSVYRFHSEVRDSDACIASLEHHVAVFSAESASVRGEMSCLEKSVIVTQHELADAQSAFIIVLLCRGA